MAYEMNLERIPLLAYRRHLKNQALYPSRKILHEQLDERFDALEKAGISNTAALKKAVSSPKKIGELSEKTGIPAEYLNILRREMGSLTPKRVKLSDFPNVDEDTVKTLAAQGIKNSKDFFDKMTQADAQKIGMDKDAFSDIYALCDIARINGMGGIAARIFVDAGYRSVADVASADAQTMHAKTCTVNNNKRYYKGVLSVKDMQFCIDYAQMMRRLSL